MQVYLNGRFLDHTEASVPLDDRGFLFADGVYEVIRVYGGVPFMAREHEQRLRRGLDALRMSAAHLPDLGEIARQLLEANDVTGHGTIYQQVTRGVAPRKHAFPAADVATTVYMVAKPFQQYPDEYFDAGVDAITTADTRWSRCDIKSIALLPNVLANQEAHEAGAFEALFIRDGVLIEGSHSNLFGVVDGRLVTYPASNYILAGITRRLVLDLAAELGIPAAEDPIYWDRRDRIEELFLSGTTTEVMPIRQVDGRAVGEGVPGPITRRLQQAFRERVARLADDISTAA